MALFELDEFKPPQFLGFVRNVPAPNEYKGQTYLPNQTVYDLAFEYVLGANRRPVMAHVMGWDSEAPIHGRAGAGAKVSGELPPIKRKSRIGEKEIARFLQPRANTPDVQIALDSVYSDAADLLDSVQARVEWLRMQALSEDVVLYDEAGVQFEFDYGIDDAFQWNLPSQVDGSGANIAEKSGTAWNSPDSNPVLTLQRLCDDIQRKTGRRPARFVTSQEAANLLPTNPVLKDMVRGTNAPNAMLSPGEIQTLFSLYGLPAIETYDVVIQKENEDGTYSDVRPLASNKGFLLPAGFEVGNKTLWGPTAESRVLYGTPLAGQAPGIWAETYSTTEPPAEWTKAAAVAFPSIPEANLIGQVTLF